MDVLRLALYGVGFVLALVMAYEFARVPHRLARVLAALLGIWAACCGVLFATLLSLSFGALPSWGAWAFTVNAVLLAVGPLALLLWWARERRDGR